MEKKKYSFRKPGDTYFSFKETKGDLEIFKNTVMYEKEAEGGGVTGASSEMLLFKLDKEIYEALKNWIPRKESKIDYKDRCYIDKRRILRQLSVKDEIENYVDIVADDVYDSLRQNFIFTVNEKDREFIKNIIDIEDIYFWQQIRTLLIDGFLCYEIIFAKEKPFALNPIDPTTLIVSPTEDGKVEWIQYPDNDKLKRVLFNDQIIYMSYSYGNDYFHTSYVEQLKESYERLKVAESSLFYNASGPKLTIKDVKWLSKCLDRASRIPEMKLNYGESDDPRYNHFIRRIVNIFKKDMLEKILKLK